MKRHSCRRLGDIRLGGTPLLGALTLLLGALTLLLGAQSAAAVDAGSASSPIAATAGSGQGGSGQHGMAPSRAATATCIEHVPEGKARPRFEESFPVKGTSGYSTVLEVVVEHGKGETVLPNGFAVQLDSDAARALDKAQFVLPDQAGPAAATLERQEQAQGASTRVRVPFVPLPREPGRQELTLPSVPIAIARASGELITVCTTPHRIIIEDPTANEPHATPKGNPDPERQREEWTTLKHAALAGLIALLVAAVTALLVRWWLRREKPPKPGPPPRPAWEIALEELHDIRHARLIEQQRYAEHFDRVSHAVRRYLGDRFGFDGLESTTREILARLKRGSDQRALAEIERFLRKADLVKFARLTPTEAECHEALKSGESIVRTTIPAVTPTASAADRLATDEADTRAVTVPTQDAEARSGSNQEAEGETKRGDEPTGGGRD